MRLQGQVALVTGAASGIGRAVASRFAKEGAAVMAADMNAAGAEAVAAAIAASGGHARGIALDVTVKASIDAAIAATRAALGPTTILVNSAGTAREVPLEGTDEALFRTLFEVNLLGTFLCAQAAAAEMVARGGGSIINIGSVSGRRGNWGRTAYGASKGGVVMLTQVLAVELAERHVRVNCICPGPVETPLVTQVHTPKTRAWWHDRVPMRRYATPEEIAGPAVETWADAMAAQHGFTQISHTLELFGLCDTCSSD